MNPVSQTPPHAAPERIVYLDTLRVLSMFAVMVLHMAASGLTASPEGSIPWIVCWFYDFAAIFAVPVFVMLSGSMFLDPSRNVTVSAVWKKHIPRLLTVFLSWSFVYALFESLESHSLFSASYFLSVLEKTVTGHYHMWYLYMLMGLYAAVPVLRKIAGDEALLRYFIILSFALNHCLSLLRLLPVAGQTFTAVSGSLHLSVFSGYAGYFCLGYYLHRKSISPKVTRWVIIGSAALFAAVSVLGMCMGVFRFGNVQLLQKPLLPFVFLYSSGVFLFFKGIGARLARCAFLRRILCRTVPCALGMYLLHPAVNLVLRKLGLHALTFCPVLCVPLCAVAVFGICYFVIALLRRLPPARPFL